MNKSDKSEKLFQLFKVVGMASKDNFSISTNKINGLTAWITGPFVILYDIKKDKQVKFLKNKNNKIFTCLSFSEDGTQLACGEGNCKNSEIIIFDITNLELEDNIKFSMKAHKYGIEKVKFFKNDKFIISIGDREDKTAQMINLSNGEIVFTSKYNRPILCFDICDNFLVLGGFQFLKLWTIEEKENKRLLVSKSNFDTGKLKDKVFTSCVIYSSQIEKRIFTLTSDGHLAEMKYSTKQLSRWFHLKTEKAISICLHDQMLVCGCSDGIIRLFKVDSMEHVVTLHRPPPLGRANIDANIKKINISVTSDERFADVVTLCYNSYYDKLISIYSDKTFFVWELKGKNDSILVDRYNSFHSGSINQMDIQITQDDIVRVATCSDDKTVKFWNFKLEDFINNTTNSRKISHIAYSKIIRRIFYFGKNFNHFKFDMENFINGGNNKIENINLTDEDVEISSVKFSPDEKYLACGDNIGNLFIYNLTNLQQVNYTNAHNAQITSIDFINTESGQYLLATGSVDNLINVIDVTVGMEEDFETFERSVLSDHQAPVTCVLFCIDKLKQTKLISCSADRSINFYLVNSASSVQLVQKFQEEDISTYSLCFNPGNNQVIAGHNGRVTMWKTKMCFMNKVFKVKKGENFLDNFRIAVDQTGSIFATTNNDKYIRIRSIIDSHLITKIPIAESISSIFFSIKNNFLIASSVEGYIYFFKMDLDNLPIKPPQPTKEKTKMNNKLKMLQKFMEEDMNFSKNDKVKALIEKMKNSEDFKLEDFKMLDSYFTEKKNPDEKLNEIKLENEEDKEELIKFVHQIELVTNPNSSSKNIKEEIEIKEEKANNEEDDDQTNNDLNKMNRSTIFEKNLKEISAEAMKKSILNHSRISLCDTYLKKKTLAELKNEIIHIPRNPTLENIFKKANFANRELKDDKPFSSLAELKKENNIKIPITEKVGLIKKEESSQNEFLNINNNLELKTNNFVTKVNPPIVKENEISNSNGKVLVTYNSKKNLKEKETNSNGALNELQQLISDTNKFVDNLDNRVNSSNDLNNINKNSFKKDPDEDYDYFSNERRLSIVDRIDNEITKSNNIFKKNLQEVENSDEIKEENKSEPISMDNKFNNFNNIKNEDKNGLFEITEDLHLEDLSETQIPKIESTMQTNQTSNLDVSDSIVNKDKILSYDINFLNSHNISQIQIDDTYANESILNTQTNVDLTQLNITTIDHKSDSISINNESVVEKKENLNLIKVNKIYNYNNKNRIPDCVTEKFSFSISNKSKVENRIKNLSNQLEEINKDNLTKEELMEFYK